jgi:parallel beta-helix repeat protein
MRASINRLVVCLAIACVVLMASFTIARSQDNQGAGGEGNDDHNATAIAACPFTTSGPGRYFLANDLTQCMGFGISITFSSVKIELRGHTIQGTFGDSAIVANEGNTALSDIEIEGPGTLTSFNDGIAFVNVHHSRVHNLVVAVNNCGIEVNGVDCTSVQAPASTENEFSDNVVMNNGGDGIAVNGSNENRFIHNNLSGNTNYGILLSNASNNEFRDNVVTVNFPDGINVNGGNENRFIHNNLSGNSNDGLFLVSATNNVARDNTTDANFASGIEIGTQGSGNRIDHNTAFGNFSFDLSDDNSTCDSNLWRNNSFNISTSAGITSPACIQ